ncbi:MAG: DUF2141 domain-containing protein [Oceanicaulis sp.]
MQSIAKTALAAVLAGAGLVAFTPAPALYAAGFVAERAEALFEPELRVRVTGAASDEGTVWIGVYADEAAYAAGTEIAQIHVPADPQGVDATFTDLPAGAYAIIAFHDANGNNDFDRNFIGVPSERFGFSNLSPRMRRARWDEAVFDHAADQTVTVELVGAGG